MRNKRIFFLMILAATVFVCRETLTRRCRNMNCGNMNQCRYGRGFGRCGGCPRHRGCCPLLDSECRQARRGCRMLKRDGKGPHKDGKGPRGCDLGPREDCPNK